MGTESTCRTRTYCKYDTVVDKYESHFYFCKGEIKHLTNEPNSVKGARKTGAKQARVSQTHIFSLSSFLLSVLFVRKMLLKSKKKESGLDRK